MIRFKFVRSGKANIGFECSGHAGYAEHGQDIVCAAISAMTMLIINTIEVSYASDVEYTIDEDTTDITVNVPAALDKSPENEMQRYAISGLLQGYFVQLMDMLEDYYDFLSVEEKEQ